jgi:hypothetical protein
MPHASFGDPKEGALIYEEALARFDSNTVPR